MARVSVVMTHFDNANYVAEAVQSVLNQTYVDLDLFLIDDCSPGSLWLDSLANFRNDKRLKIYRSDKNVGTYRLKNKLLAEIDSEFVAFHDSDDYSAVNRIELQFNTLMAHEAVSLLGTRFIQIGLNNQRTKIDMSLDPESDFYQGERFLSLHPTWMIRKKLFDILGGFDGETRIAGDDEFYFRAILGSKVMNMPDYLYFKRDHPASLTLSPGTGFGSEARKQYAEYMFSRTNQLIQSVANGDLSGLTGRQNNVAFCLNRLD
jgi:glycosyltransferase involved in cell wall biosynthesis